MPSKQLVGICGIYCGACVGYRAYKDKDQTLIQILAERGLSRDEIRCEGCSSDSVSSRCSACVFKECVKDKGISNCSECSHSSCEKLTDLSERRARNENKPHLTLCPANLKRLREIGAKQWLAEQEQRWSCSSCGKKLHWYSELCPECGTKFFNATREAKTTDEDRGFGRTSV